MKKILKYIGLFIVFTWFMVGGITHFTDPSFYLDIMPPYLPLHLEIVYFSGILEIIFAGLLLVPSQRQLSGNLLIALTLAVTPANIYMWQNPGAFPDIEPFLLSVRLVVQVLLILTIWKSTRRERQDLIADPNA